MAFNKCLQKYTYAFFIDLYSRLDKRFDKIDRLTRLACGTLI